MCESVWKRDSLAFSLKIHEMHFNHIEIPQSRSACTLICKTDKALFEQTFIDSCKNSFFLNCFCLHLNFGFFHLFATTKEQQIKWNILYVRLGQAAPSCLAGVIVE